MSDELHKAFIHQRSRARQRRIQWELEYWQWLQIWQESGHLHERGTKKGDWVMARNGDVGPYSLENVKIIRCESNNSFASLAMHRNNKLRKAFEIYATKRIR